VPGIGEKEVGPLRISRRPAAELAQMVARALGRAPGRERRQPAVGAVALERRHLHVTLEAGQEVRVVEEKEWAEGLLRGHHLALAPGIRPHRALAGDEGEEAGRLVPAEEQGIAVEGEGDRGQFSMPR